MVNALPPFSAASEIKQRRGCMASVPSVSSPSTDCFAFHDILHASFAVDELNRRRLALMPGSTLPPRERNLELMLRYTAALGLDLRRLPPVVHVAGTKGKGSVCAMTEAMLRAAGLRTLFFTSPHLFELRERFRINSDVVPEVVFLRHFWAVHDAIMPLCSSRHGDAEAAHESERRVDVVADGTLRTPPSGCPAPPGSSLRPTALPVPSFFMLFTLIAFHMALTDDLAIDALVLEVGIGGVIDCTNVIPASAVAATGVTTLDFDHTDVLGSSLAEIATHKAGIFKAGVPAFTVPQEATALAALARVAAEADVSVDLQVATAEGLAARAAGGSFPPLSLDGDFQRTNAALAAALAETLIARREAMLACRRSEAAHSSATARTDA